MDQRDDVGYLQIAEKVNADLVGTVQFRDLAQRIVDFAAKELHLNTVAVFRVTVDGQRLHAYTYTHRMRSLIDRILPKPFASYTAPLTELENAAVRTVVTGKPQQSLALADFAKKVVPEYIVHKIQHIMGAKLFIAYPVHDPNNAIVGALMFGITETTISPALDRLLRFFTDQIGTIFASALQFEHVLAKYKAEREYGITRKETHKEKPTIKFTLRVTKRQQQFINAHIRGSSKTKAKFIRELLDTLIAKKQ